jgi:hypothetical protein
VISTLTGPFAPLGHSKQIRHWSLMRMLYSVTLAAADEFGHGRDAVGARAVRHHHRLMPALRKVLREQAREQVDR